MGVKLVIFWLGTLLALLVLSRIALLLFLYFVPVEERVVNSVDLDKKHYEAIQPSMTIDQVISTIGCEPAEVIKPGDPYQVPGYYWRDSEGDEIRVSAPNGIVESAAAFGSEVAAFEAEVVHEQGDNDINSSRSLEEGNFKTLME